MQRLAYSVRNSRLAVATERLIGRFPKLLDDVARDELPFDEKSLKDKQNYRAYARAEILDNGQHTQSTKQIIMVEIKLENGFLHFDQIPGVHDVSGSGEVRDSYHIPFDPFDDFIGILRNGFDGGAFCNVVFLGSKPVQRFKEFEFNPPSDTSLHLPAPHNLYALKDEIKGDRYRLLLWSGFTKNYSRYHYTNNRTYSKFAFGTVMNCPSGHVAPFIVLAQGLEEAQIRVRLAFYRAEFERLGIPCPAFLRRETYEKVE